MKIILKKKDGTVEELTLEQAREIIKNKKATIDPLKCKTEKIKDKKTGKEILNIYAPALTKLIKKNDPNRRRK